MSTSRILFASLAVSSCCGLAAYADPVTLDLRPGLWEMTTSGQSSGAPPIPADVLDRMPPERRAKFEAAIKASQARAAQPHAFKKCITQADLRRGLKLDDKEEGDCRQTILSSTASVMDLRMECKSPQRTSSGTFHFESAGPQAVTGAVDMTIGDGVHTMTMHRVIQGKWTGSDCGNVRSAGE